MADSVKDDDEPEVDDVSLEKAALASGNPPAAAAVPGVETKKGFGRFGSFLRASWAELQRVQWPDRGQVGQATAVVIGFVIIAGAYLGVADAAAKKVVDIIL